MTNADGSHSYKSRNFYAAAELRRRLLDRSPAICVGKDVLSQDRSMRYEACASLSWELVACRRQRISSSLVLIIIKASELPQFLVFIVRCLLPL